MIIKCLRTGKVVEKGFANSDEARAALLRRIRQTAADQGWLPENVEAVVLKYERTGNHPFMFDLGPEPRMTARERRAVEQAGIDRRKQARGEQHGSAEG